MHAQEKFINHGSNTKTPTNMLVWLYFIFFVHGQSIFFFIYIIFSSIKSMAKMLYILCEKIFVCLFIISWLMTNSQNTTQTLSNEKKGFI